MVGFAALSPTDILKMENEAHEALLSYAQKKGWSKEEIAKLQANQKHWQDLTAEHAINPEKVERGLQGLMNKAGLTLPIIGQNYYIVFANCVIVTPSSILIPQLTLAKHLLLTGTRCGNRGPKHSHILIKFVALNYAR